MEIIANGVSFSKKGPNVNRIWQLGSTKGAIFRVARKKRGGAMAPRGFNGLIDPLRLAVPPYRAGEFSEQARAALALLRKPRRLENDRCMASFPTIASARC